jgi:cytidylate kinase
MVRSIRNVPVVTIDGPGGSGKGTLAQMLATRLGWHLLDSGALYRLVGLAARIHGVALDNQEALAVLSRHMDVQFLATEPQTPATVILEGEDVTWEIRTEEVGRLASAVAVHAAVRDGLLDRQHDFREPPGLVADGRDMGTIVFPDAVLKIFLTADVEERARRRFKQLQDKGMSANLSHLCEAIRQRDEQDINRPVAPLKPAVDAVIIDSSSLSIDLVFAKVMELVEQRNLI